MNRDNVAKVALNLSLFIFFLATFLKSEYNPLGYLKNSDTSSNAMYIIFMILCFTSIIFGISGESILIAAYGSSDFTEKSSLHEYFILFYSISLFYSKKRSVFFLINTIVLLIYVTKTLLYGGRIEVFQSFLIYVNYYFLLRRKIGYGIIISFYLFLSTLGSLVSILRSDPTLLIDFNLVEFVSEVKGSLFGDVDEVKNSNQGDVLQASTRIEGMANEGFVSFEFRIKSFFSFILSPIIPKQYQFAEYNLAGYEQERFRSGGGGLISSYSFFWLGIFGPIIFAIILAFILNNCFQAISDYSRYLLLITASTFPRWLFYSPVILIKMCLYGFITVVIFSSIKKLFFSDTKATSTY